MESEYTALSMALRATIPLFTALNSVIKVLFLSTDQKITFKPTVHKVNQGAIVLANLHIGSHTPRSKFCALRLHCFFLLETDLKLCYSVYRY